MCDTSSERKFFSVHNDVMREYIHIFVKSQDGFIWPMVKDTGIRISLTFLWLYKILIFFNYLFLFIDLLYFTECLIIRLNTSLPNNICLKCFK